MCHQGGVRMENYSAGQNVDFVFSALLNESLSAKQRMIYQKILSSDQKLQIYKEERKELLQKYEKFSSFIFGEQSEEYNTLNALSFVKSVDGNESSYENNGPDEQIDFLRALFIVNNYLLDSDLSMYVVEDSFDLQECFSNYKKSKRNISPEIETAVELYQLIVQVLDKDHKEAVRIKESLLDIVEVDDSQDSNIVCFNILNQLRLLYNNKVIDESLLNTSVDLIKHYIVYSENDHEDFVMASEDEPKKNVKHN